MRVLYLSSTHAGILSKGIYSDLMQEFKDQGHDVTVAYAKEARLNEATALFERNGIHYLGIKTMNMSKNKNLLSKGLALLTFDRIFARNLKKYLSTSFDLVLYSTPPVNLIHTLKTLKKRNPNALFYLMLKDIFPQNAIDLGLIGSRGLISWYFKRKEATLYKISDWIGVMSRANQQFVLDTYLEYQAKVEILPNTITLNEEMVQNVHRSDYGLPEDKVLLLYGGNLGLPQSVPFILECYEHIQKNTQVALVIAGSGAQDKLLKEYIHKHQPHNLFYLGSLPQTEYDALAHLCDVGLIFLDYRFTVPNYPQRLLGYLSNRLPVICATDEHTDIGTDAQNNGYGYAVPSNNAKAWQQAVEQLIDSPNLRQQMGEKGYQYLLTHFTSDRAYSIIMNHK